MALPPLKDHDALVRRIARARPKGRSGPATERARKLLSVYLETAKAHGLPLREVMAELASGRAAQRIAGVELQSQAAQPGGPASRAACAEGCAFCCILRGADGGTILEVEARTLHAALAPLAGRPDGRAWHPEACPALDPATRMCRAYEARPMICRSYMSEDVQACQDIAAGRPAAGAGVLGAQGLYLAAQALIRAALAGATPVRTYSLARLAAAAVAGQDEDAALKAAKQPPATLGDERERLTGLG